MYNLVDEWAIFGQWNHLAKDDFIIIIDYIHKQFISPINEFNPSQIFQRTKHGITIRSFKFTQPSRYPQVIKLFSIFL